MMVKLRESLWRSTNWRVSPKNDSINVESNSKTWKHPVDKYILLQTNKQISILGYQELNYSDIIMFVSAYG